MPVQALRLKPDLAYLTNSKEARVDEAECARGSGKRRARRRRLGIGHGDFVLWCRGINYRLSRSHPNGPDK